MPFQYLADKTVKLFGCQIIPDDLFQKRVVRTKLSHETKFDIYVFIKITLRKKRSGIRTFKLSFHSKMSIKKGMLLRA